MTENGKLKQLRHLVKRDFDTLDARVERLCGGRATKGTPRLVARAFSEGFLRALGRLIRETIGREFASSTREFRALVRTALLPGIRCRMTAYKERFPEAVELFDECEREAHEWFEELLHPADSAVLLDAEPGKFEACYRGGQPVAPILVLSP